MFSSKDLFFTPAAGGYTVSKSLRFRSSASAYLNRTPSSTGNRQIWTISMWVKRGSLGTYQALFSCGTSSSADRLELSFNSDAIQFGPNISSTWYQIVTSQVFRDTSAWYHIVGVVDTTQSTASNRTKLYVNGVQVTAFSSSSYPAQNANTSANLSGTQMSLGYYSPGPSGYFDGYLAEVNFIDGQALTPSSFGENDTTTGIWNPKAYTGTYGTNGFYLKFTDVGATSGSNTGYGQDFSGNGNYWTTNNFGTTSTATTYDSMLDSPTNATGDIGNYAVWSPLVLFANTTYQATMSNANLLMTRSAGGQGGAVTTIGATSGKYYAEVTVTAAGTSVPKVAVVADNNPSSLNSGNEYVPGITATSVAYRSDGGKTYNNATTASWGSTYTTGDIIGVAFDADSGKVWFAKNNTWQASGDPAAGTNPANTLGTGVPFYFSVAGESGASLSFNTGQRPLSYTAPSGFSALNTQNLTTPTITNGAQYMAAVLYNGTSASNTVTATATNSGNNPLPTTFQPDLVWIKSRSAATNHELTDAVRGTTKSLNSNATAAEATDTNGLTAFTSSGFTVGSDSNYNNGTGPATYVAWQWQAGTAPTVDNSAGAGNVPTAGSVKINGANSTATLAGSIAATRLSANTSAGFSVVTYAGNGSSSATVGHGLGVAPSMIILKNRTSARSWPVMHTSLPSNGNVFLDLTQAYQTTYSTGGIANPANSTTFGFTTTSTLEQVNASGSNYVAYCFAPVAGYSAFGTYVANGSSDGPFVYTGMRPRYILTKCSTAATDWTIHDTSRNLYNVSDASLYTNTSGAETTLEPFDILSNGFKIRSTAGNVNSSGNTYIYAAFAENPFKISRAR